MARVVWSSEARRDLAGLVNWIARDAPAAASRMGRKITAATARLRKFPESGSPVEDTSHVGLREIFVDPYRVIYFHEKTRCVIVGVLHSKQDLARWQPPELPS